MFTALKRIFVSGFQNFRRNLWISLAVVGVTAVTLFVFSNLLLFSFFTREVIAVIQNKIDLSVYFNTQIAEEEILKARDVLRQLPEVKDVTYVSRDEALQKFRERHLGNEVVINALEELGGNPLQASLNIKAQTSESYQTIVTFIEQAPFKNAIAKINFMENKLVIERLNKIITGVQRAGLVAVVVFVGLAVLVSFNSVRMAIYSFREEINVMKLVGASRWFIRGPFVVMGLGTVVLASAVVMLILWVGVLVVSPRISGFIPEINMLEFFKHNAFKIFVFQTLAGAVIAAFSAYIAMGRYLKEK
ncbi:MAG: hypothetical protein COX12_02205 [Candidatus Brennerbacteria bacterium CG23_combo_of_CG06-09_8_20_14_all_44_41]|nr:MAG: hypothetical protein AUJ43_00860 [Parcubacteria group bacterium CG1_02_44_31]PIP50276.1 MAG: hypothetical protein COX12_02205 [Candidatus Brennerbacteria bacterium CG23_combo_of_CG06-09_8_20_14_all_44_41]